MHFLLVTWISFFACSNNSDAPSASSETVDQNTGLERLVQKWQRSHNQFAMEMDALSDMERLYVVRKILSDPKAEHSPRLCQTLNKQHQDYCIQMLGRSHIWDIPISEEVVETTAQVKIEQCSENDVWCLTSTALQETKHGRIERAADICDRLPDTQAREECFFQSAEQISKQDRESALEQAFTFCNKINAYQEHCHAHIIEFAASTFQPPANLLQIIKDNAGKKTAHLQSYYLTMKARHSPNNRFLPHWDRHSVQTLIFLQTQPKEAHTLTDWIDGFVNSRSTMVMDSLKLNEEINNYWIQQGQTQHPSKLYLSLETRPFSEDEYQDLQFAMVAALVQLRFPLEAIVSTSNHPTIQWMLNRASHKR